MLRETVSDFVRDEGLRHSAALAYYSAFSLAPLLLIAFSIAGTIFGDDAARGAIFDELRRDLGDAGAAALQDMVAHAHQPAKSLAMSLLGLVVLLFGAAGLFGQLQAAINAVWNVPPASGSGVWYFVKARFLSFAMVLGTGFLLMVSMIASAVLHGIGHRVGEIAEIPAPVWGVVGNVLSMSLITLLFAAIFKVLPDVHVRWRDVWAGAVFTAALFIAGKSVIAWYLGREAMASGYGSAGAVIVILSWLYYSAAILLFGAEFTQVFARARGSDFAVRDGSPSS